MSTGKLRFGFNFYGTINVLFLVLIVFLAEEGLLKFMFAGMFVLAAGFFFLLADRVTQMEGRVCHESL